MIIHLPLVVSLWSSSDAHQDRGTDCQLRLDLSVSPGQEFIKTRNLVVGNSAENVGKPGLWIDAVEFGGFDYGFEHLLVVAT